MTSPAGNSQRPHWCRHLFYRKESWKTTWKLRLAVLLLAAVIVTLPHAFWAERVAQSLICQELTPRSDALLLENFDPDYLVFERATALQRAAVAPRVLVPVQREGALETPNPVYKGFAEVMTRVAWLQHVELIPIDMEIEPISLNAATQIRDFLTRENLKSVVVVAPAFRSRRSALVYDKVLSPAGITVGCVPVFGIKTPETWPQTWHGIQSVTEQFLKLQYYRFWVLR